MNVDIQIGDCRALLAAMEPQSVNCCVTSPPYFGLRDYGVDGQIGLEQTPDEYVAEMVAVFRAVRRVLRDDGTLWLNLGDSYAANRKYQVPSTKGGKKHGPGQSAGGRGSRVPEGLKPKDLLMIPSRVALALQSDGWWLRSHIIWNKPNAMPESVRDRPVCAHESIFLLTKSERYYYDHEAVKEDAVSDHPSGNGFKRDARLSYSDANGPRGNDSQWTGVGGKRNLRNVWTKPTKPFAGAHFAVFPPDLIEPCILAGCPAGGVVLDPFGGAGTTGLVAKQQGRNAVLLELNPEYAAMASDRIDNPPAVKRKRAANDNNRDLFTATDTPVSAVA